ncbi:hypothetical protein, partial [Streptomyces sp. MBT60]|uniref:hypothetical protein n=1 Tax=Streptomyces sp. MBT60 TaxID=2800409 RepID=UPI001F271AFA
MLAVQLQLGEAGQGQDLDPAGQGAAGGDAVAADVEEEAAYGEVGVVADVVAGGGVVVPGAELVQGAQGVAQAEGV